jgi:hypothetical protein
MMRSRWLLLSGAAILVIGAWVVVRGRSERVAFDFIQELPHADRRPRPDTFSVVSATLNGETKQAILTREQSRLTFQAAVPADGWIRVSLGLLEEAWTVPGDGVEFLVGVNDGSHWDELMSLVVNPYANPSDRRWNHVLLDVSPYAGKTVSFVFDTFASPPPAPGHPPHADSHGDLAVWGEPQLVVR